MNVQRTQTFTPAAFVVGILLTIPTAFGQDNSRPNVTSDGKKYANDWKGKRENGSVLTYLGLQEILRLHKLWSETGGTKGKRARLVGADLTGANLAGMNLTGAYLWDANVTGAFMDATDLTNADLDDANLTGTQLNSAILTNAKLRGAKLIGTALYQANLTGARLNGADLSGARMRETRLTDAQLKHAILDGAVFEPNPKSLPYLPYLASVKNLDKLRYEKYENGLVELRNALRQAGFRRQEREVNYSLLRCRREIMQMSPRGFGDRVDAAFNYYFFEITCKYGLLPGRPLQILGVVVLAFAVPYFWVLWRRERSSRSDIWLEVDDEAIRPNRNRKRRIRLLLSAGTVPRWRARVKRLRRTMVAAVYFSLLTAFRVGFREINVGNWITRMQCREYTIRATGWIRFVTGVQSLISVALVALWLVTYFGRPFQ